MPSPVYPLLLQLVESKPSASSVCWTDSPFLVHYISNPWYRTISSRVVISFSGILLAAVKHPACARRRQVLRRRLGWHDELLVYQFSEVCFKILQSSGSGWADCVYTGTPPGMVVMKCLTLLSLAPPSAVLEVDPRTRPLVPRHLSLMIFPHPQAIRLVSSGRDILR